MAVRNSPQRFIDFPLKCSDLNIQGQIETRPLAAKVLEQRGHVLSESGFVAMDLCGRILVEEGALQDPVRFSDAHSTDPFFCSGNEEPPQRTIGNGISHAHSLSSFQIGAGCHSHTGQRPFIESTAGAISRFIERAGYIRSFPDQ
jgi:hypothetical protein